MSSSPDPKRALLRHAIATLAYRGGKTLRDTPDGFAAFRAGDTTRSPGEILAHVGDLLDWAISALSGKEHWHDSTPLPWAEEVARFHGRLAVLDERLIDGSTEVWTCERLLQGPIADAFTHIGQIGLLRRLAGRPVRGENYARADIAPGRVSADQAPPVMEFAREHETGKIVISR